MVDLEIGGIKGMSDDFMKSALDRAMERADRIELPEETLKQMNYRSEAERLAAEFLKEPQYDLAIALKKYDTEARAYITKALESVLLQNLILPKKESDIAANKILIDGISSLKKNQGAVHQAADQLNSLSDYYVQARKQHYDQLKAQVGEVLAQQILQQTGAPPPGNLNVEQTPQFAESWRQVSAKLDGEYDKALAQLKDQISSVK